MVTVFKEDLSQRDHKLVWRGRVALIAKPDGPNTGFGRYSQILHQGLLAAGVNAVRIAPTVPHLPNIWYSFLLRLGIDLRAFLTNYPVWVKYPQADLYHLASQNLASLLIFHRPRGKVIVTVHDIFPYMLRDEPNLSVYRSLADRWFDRLAMKGLRRADRLFATSHYTKQCIVEHLGISAEKIQVVYPGIDHDHFQPRSVPVDIYERYGLAQERKYMIYVGSEDPRKNLPTLVHALAEIRRKSPGVELIKVGRAHFNGERRRLVELATQLGVRSSIHFLDDVPEADLSLLYNLADIFVLPSLYEGFGFPVLEAQACAVPTIYANTGSLPEVAGEAGKQFSPLDVGALIEACQCLLENENERSRLSREGYQWAAKYTWEQTLLETTKQYALVHKMERFV